MAGYRARNARRSRPCSSTPRTRDRSPVPINCEAESARAEEHRDGRHVFISISKNLYTENPNVMSDVAVLIHAIIVRS